MDVCESGGGKREGGRRCISQRRGGEESVIGVKEQCVRWRLAK